MVSNVCGILRKSLFPSFGASHVIIKVATFVSACSCYEEYHYGKFLGCRNHCGKGTFTVPLLLILLHFLGLLSLWHYSGTMCVNYLQE